MRWPARFFVFGFLGALSVLAFANVPIGATIENLSLPTLAGGEETFLSDTNVSAFIFINPELANSNQALAEISVCAKEMTNHPAHWCCIVSDRVPRKIVEAEVKKMDLKMPVLIDRGDALYGKLGVFLHPVVGITDEHRRLVAYEHFTKVNYAAVVQAQVRHALKEISDDELALVLHPPPATLDRPASIAHRYFRLATRQFANTNLDQALTNIQKSLVEKPTAEAEMLRAKILAALGRTEESKAAYETSLKMNLEIPVTNSTPPGLKP